MRISYPLKLFLIEKERKRSRWNQTTGIVPMTNNRQQYWLLILILLIIIFLLVRDRPCSSRGTLRDNNCFNLSDNLISNITNIHLRTWIFILSFVIAGGQNRRSKQANLFFRKFQVQDDVAGWPCFLFNIFYDAVRY